jgi:hypothetical protein
MPTTLPITGNARTEAALKRLHQAMASIEAEIVENKGIYPFNYGRVTQSELCRRADVKKATLQNPLHKDTTRVEIITWLDNLNSKLTRTREGTRQRVTAVADNLASEVEHLTVALGDAHVQLAQARQLLAELQQAKLQMPLYAAVTGEFTTGAKLRHYKGGRYTVVGSCLIESTLKPGVLYKPLQGDKQDIIWMRPLAEFQDKVSTADGDIARFTLLTEGE